MTKNNLVDRWRRKSEGQRKSLTLALSAGLTLFIAFVWLVNLRLTFSPSGKNQLASPIQGGITSAGRQRLPALERIQIGWQKLRQQVIGAPVEYHAPRGK